MSERYEIGSPQWLAALHAFMAAARPGMQLSRDLTLCEVYRDVPASVSSSGTVAFTSRFRKDSDEVEFELSEANDADFKLTIDYKCVVPMARIVVGGEAEKQAQLLGALTEAMKAGRAKVDGAMSEELMALPVHDQIARISV